MTTGDLKTKVSVVRASDEIAISYSEFRDQPTDDNELYFLTWGTKNSTCSSSVSYTPEIYRK